MFKEIFLFEISYRKARAATYVFFGITFFLCFLGVASPIIKLGSAVTTIHANAPYIIYRMTLVASFALSMVTSAIMGVAIIRDFDHNMEGILFSMPIKKWDYLMGRFWGSFVTLVFINMALPLGFIIGFMVGEYMPWQIAWKDLPLLSINPWYYIQPFLLIVLPNLFTTCALFFMSGALGRKSIVIYMQGIILVVLYQIGYSYLSDLDSRYLAAIIDPFGLQTFVYMTQYWTPAEQDTLLIPFAGPMLINRLLWIGVGCLALLLTQRFFLFTVVRSSFASKIKLPTTVPQPLEVAILPKVHQLMNVNTHIKQICQLSLLHFKMIWREVPFIAIAGSGIILFFFASSQMNSIYGTTIYPTTASMLDVINNSFNLFFLIIIIFYSGELIWKERSAKFNMIYDSLPVSGLIVLLSKFIGLLMVYVGLILVLIVCSVIAQTAYGYFSYDLPVYFKTLFGSTFINLLLVTLLSFFIQVIVNNKFSGFVITIGCLILNSLLSQFGVEHDLWQFGSGNLGSFSDMNFYGHFVKPFVLFKIYWIAFSFILFVVGVVFSVQGAETLLKVRWRSARSRLTRPLLLFASTMICIFLSSGIYIYYNTTIINKYEKSEARKEKRADYEKLLHQYKDIIQPKIVETNLAIELYPSARDFTAEGYYYLKNKSQQPIVTIHIQNNMVDQVTINYLKFEGSAKIKAQYKNFGYIIYELQDSLQPNDSVKLNFKLSFVTKGFVEGASNTDIVYNGTFFNNTYFPNIGYNPNLELDDREDRKRYGLNEQDQLPDTSDSIAQAVNAESRDADRIRLETVLGTEEDQTAVAPGYLLDKWKKNSRNYFRYKTDRPVGNFYSIVSGRYAVKHDLYKNVNLDIYYHPGHEFNLDRMMNGMKQALHYCSNNFIPFPFRQLRIIEFPHYHTFERSFANTIPFSEGTNFMLKVKDADKDLDMAYYVTAREVARQWWGQQVISANVKGGALLSEGMSQYVALMVMKHSFSEKLVEQYLKKELDNYLRGRTQERGREYPLALVGDQSYIYRNKAALVFFTLQDYLGEEKLNKAFSTYFNKWAFKNGLYPSSDELLLQIRNVTPDSLQYLLHDMFETVTFFESKGISAVFKESTKSKFELTFTTSNEKTIIDSTGKEKNIPIHDWVDIGVYATDLHGEEKLIYLKKHKIDKKDNTFVISVNEKPSRAGIDPLHKLIDRHADDNTINAEQFIEITNLPAEL